MKFCVRTKNNYIYMYKENVDFAKIALKCSTFLMFFANLAFVLAFIQFSRDACRL